MNDDDELLDDKAACAFIGGSKPIHPATLYRGIKDGRFSPPIKIGPGISRWKKSELKADIKRIEQARP